MKETNKQHQLFETDVVYLLAMRRGTLAQNSNKAMKKHKHYLKSVVWSKYCTLVACGWLFVEVVIVG